MKLTAFPPDSPDHLFHILLFFQAEAHVLKFITNLGALPGPAHLSMGPLGFAASNKLVSPWKSCYYDKIFGALSKSHRLLGCCRFLFGASRQLNLELLYIVWGPGCGW